jgi:hypothetical protein
VQPDWSQLPGRQKVAETEAPPSTFSSILGVSFNYVDQLIMQLPFTRENRPWLASDCIESMNLQWMNCLSKIPEEYRHGLQEWAAVKVEMLQCRDQPEVSDACHSWGDRWLKEQLANKTPPGAGKNSRGV